jgi:hypothetical protein
VEYGGSWRSVFLCPTCDNGGFEAEKRADLLDDAGFVSHANGEMMGRAFGHPAFQKGADVAEERAPAIEPPARS